MKKTDTGFASVFKNRSNRFEARLKVPGMPPLHVGSYATPAMAALALARALGSDDAKAVLSEPTKEKRAALAKAFQAKMRLAREQHRETAEPLDKIKSASDAEAASIAEAEGLELQPNKSKDGYVGVCWQKSSYRATVANDGQKLYLGRFQSKKGGALAIARWIAANCAGFRPRVSGRVVRGDPDSGVTVDFASLDALQGVDAVHRALRAQPSRAGSDGSESPSDDVSFARFLEQESDMPRD